MVKICFRSPRMTTLCFAFALSFQSLWLSSIHATPLYALRESQNCQGCHEPGRTQQPPMWRRCTLDCQGCHIDPSGGGGRNQWGAYYAYNEQAMINLFRQQDPLEDKSRIDFHYDGRILQRQIGGQNRWIPMSSEFSVRVRPMVRYLHLIYQNIMMGRVGDPFLRVVREGDRRFRERFAVMIDELPYNTYLRAYRGTPMYGLKRPNHSLWIRERIGLDQYATTDAIEIGGTPNVPFFRASLMAGDPYVPDQLRQKGASFHGGLRGVTAGWHLNASYWNTQSQSHAVNMSAFGAGFHEFNVLGYLERNWRRTEMLNIGGSETNYGSVPHPSSTIDEFTLAYTGVRGLMLGSVFERLQQDSLDASRQSLFIDLHPIPFLHFELWRRYRLDAVGGADSLAIIHLFADL